MAGRRALILANSLYDDPRFPPLPAAEADARALREVLADPAVGDFAVETRLNATRREAARALKALFTEAGPDDLLLLHLSLHGWKDENNRLHFVASDTEREDVGFTAVPADAVNEWMRRSRSRSIVLMLDCCYSGAFALGTVRRAADAPRVDVATPFAGKGRVVITASTALQFAHEGQAPAEGEEVRTSRDDARPSVFTSAVVDGLRDGSADLDGDGHVSVHDLYGHVHDQVSRRIKGQTPTLSVDSVRGTIHLARNPRGPAPTTTTTISRDPLAELHAALNDKRAWRRAGALLLIERHLADVREQYRAAAHQALLRLIADPDPDVARRAQTLFHNTPLATLPDHLTQDSPPDQPARSRKPTKPDQGTQHAQFAQDSPPEEPARLAQPAQPGQAEQFAQAGPSAQPEPYGQAAQLGQAEQLRQGGQAAQPEQSGQAEQLGQDRQAAQPAQPARPGQPGQPGQPGRAGSPGRAGRDEMSGQGGQGGQGLAGGGHDGEARVSPDASGRSSSGGFGARLVGIDFGTTNSAVGVVEGGGVRVIPGRDGAATTPSLVAIADDGSVLVGAEARRQAGMNSAYTIRSAKLRLGTGWSVTRGKVRITAERAVELLLERLRADAEAYLGGPIGGAVLTVPASFTHRQREELALAARTAGVDVVRMVNEPTAAAIAYGLSRRDEATVLVFDLGGGTFDVSVVDVADGLIEVCATAGDNHLGGDDWDARLVDHLVAAFQRRHGVSLRGNSQALHRVRAAAEEAKIQLSAARSTEVNLPYITAGTGDFQDPPVHLTETVTRAEFETMTRDLLDRCRKIAARVIRAAGMSPSDLDHVILTGGATRMPAVAALVRRLTGRDDVHRGLIPEGVVTGAALNAGVLEGRQRDLLLLDVRSFPVGLETAGAGHTEVVAKDTPLPFLRWTLLAPSHDGQTALTAHLMDDPADGCDTLAVLRLTGLRSVPAGTPVAEATVAADVTGTLSLRLRELRGTPDALPGRARELARLRADQRAGDEIPDDFYTGREESVTVTDAVSRAAAALVRSAAWRAHRDDLPMAWKD
ncbi:caspase, EACC1-associated type [Actinocorallia sp. A-T 12471]|uniref:caspase, EACC1-associated type n=1 Tax=Actinocorallia sp. A-T 12471 TaxID=3089813 RepID=UPI0029CC1D47|nr:Hsp70 family protein [Actinocorallia sp. A-T 12471]MDX6742139.1 Hsp70 family protein [Actinocorallia sp. A-T 12471]